MTAQVAELRYFKCRRHTTYNKIGQLLEMLNR